MLAFDDTAGLVMSSGCSDFELVSSGCFTLSYRHVHGCASRVPKLLTQFANLLDLLGRRECSIFRLLIFIDQFLTSKVFMERD